MQTQEHLSGPSEREIQLETQGFIQHMEQKHTNIERDLLLLEVSRKLRLTDDLRFSYFFDHCKQYKSKPSFENVTHYAFGEYLERLQALVDDLAKDACRSEEVETFQSVLQVVHTLFKDYCFFELGQTLRDRFPEYYSNHANIT